MRLIKEFLLIDISYIFWNILGNFLYGILYLYSGKGKKKSCIFKLNKLNKLN